MKNKLYIKNKHNHIVYHPEAIVFFAEKKIKNGLTKEGKSFLIMPTEKSYKEFCEKFIFPKDLMIVVKKYSPGQLFAYYDRMCEENERLIGEITSTNGILGDGIYTISEKDFLENIEKENMLINYNHQRTGINTNKEVIMIVQYYGYFYKVMSENLNGLCKLITINIPLDSIKTVMELTVSIA